jgi:hypothetical protein
VLVIDLAIFIGGITTMTRYALTENELNGIQSVIAYKAEQLRVSHGAIEQSVCRFFWVQSLRELMKWDFDGVIRHLLGLRGCADVER